MIDYEKKYNEAPERAKTVMGNACHEETKTACGEIFPELAESEDERIRKALIEAFNSYHWAVFPMRGFEREQYIAWLEKQKEQQPAECIIDKEMKQSMDALHDFKVFATDLAKTFNITHERDIDWHNFCAGLLTYLERNKPAEWSEEDEWLLKRIITDVECQEIAENITPSDAKERIAWLKSLRPQPIAKLPKWKQVEAEYTYPLCLTREMDVNGDYQYCLSSGKIYDGCEYISVAELSKLPREE